MRACTDATSITFSPFSKSARGLVPQVRVAAV